jgi:hypothetical protein
MDPFSWLGLLFWIGLGSAAALGAVLVWAAIAEAREEAGEAWAARVTEADWKLLRSWLSDPSTRHGPG